MGQKKIWRGVGPGHPAEDSLTLRGLSSKPFSSLSTRLAHAARLGFLGSFYKNALYKFTVITVIIPVPSSIEYSIELGTAPMGSRHFGISVSVDVCFETAAK